MFTFSFHSCELHADALCVQVGCQADGQVAQPGGHADGQVAQPGGHADGQVAQPGGHADGQVAQPGGYADGQVAQPVADDALEVKSDSHTDGPLPPPVSLKRRRSVQDGQAAVTDDMIDAEQVLLNICFYVQTCVFQQF